MLPYPAVPAGRFEHPVIDSVTLRGNPLGDPHRRPLLVYLPPGYDEDRGRRYPVIYVTPGYGGHAGTWFNRTPFRRPHPELVDALYASGDVPPAIVVFADGWTRYGGSQFLNSPATGDYHFYLCDELVPWIDARYRTVADRDHRALAGKSTGGYVAMITPMLRPDLFGALATHAGDALFDVGYRSELTRRARLLRDLYDGSYDRFLKEFHTRVPGTKPGDFELMEVYAYASAYSADEDGTVRIPFDDTGALLPEVWNRWLAWDPVLLATRPAHAEALRSLRAVWIDAGNKDEYYLDFGATAFHRALRSAGVPDDRITFELFDGTHGAIEYRYPLALGWLSERMG
ncbi:alpha/beta hydrolase-fold protein [Streptomyces sp. HSW2009]|uniref:alpha/beta hydrolase n=1 Tax=Streptomyces sp. HSW2009 TaxID=3142890 RepID=UPI0032EC79A5